MKLRRILSITLVLSVLLLFPVSLAATAQAAPQRFKADLGVITHAAGQTLRVTVAGDSGTDAIRVRIHWMQYGPQGCSGMPQVCRHVVVAQGVTSLETLGPDDALSFDVQGTGAGVRLVVESNSRNAKVSGIVFDTATQRVTGYFETEML